MREIFTHGTEGGAPGNRGFYPDIPSESCQKITRPCQTVNSQEQGQLEALGEYSELRNGDLNGS